MRWVINATPRPLYPREREPVHIVQEAGLVAGPVWLGAENFAPTGIRSPDRSYTDWAIPAHKTYCIMIQSVALKYIVS